MSIAGFILARADSKRLPNKNTRLLCGKELICWTIDSAIESGVIDTLVVGTDDRRVLKVCMQEKYLNKINNKIITLPEYITRDNSRSEEAMIYCMNKIQRHDAVMLLQATSPIRNIEDIHGIVNQFNNNDNKPINSVNEETEKFNGSLYIIKWDDLLYTMNITRDINNNIICDYFPMPANRSVDIDTQEDFDKAEMLMKERLTNMTDSVYAVNK